MNDSSTAIADFLGRMSAERGAAANTLDAYGRDLGEFTEYLAEEGLALDAVAPKHITEYLRHLDMLRMKLPGELVMRASNIEYHAPARFDDLLEVFIRVSRIGRTSATYDMAAYRVDDDVLMVTANQTLVLVDLEKRKACQIPDVVRERIQAFEGDDVEL